MSNIISQTIEIAAPIEQVWQSISSHAEFGDWFGMTLDAPFKTGATVNGNMSLKDHGDCIIQMQIVRMEPPTQFAYKWHPYALDASYDYAQEEPTLVEFKLEPHAVGTKLTVVESGFDKVPEARRAEAFRMNTQGWQYQIKQVKEHAERHAA